MALTAKFHGSKYGRESAEYQRKRWIALEDLRALQDPRGIPLLIPCLESGDGISGEAYLAYQALSAMPDLVPVRMALMSRLHKSAPLNSSHAEYFACLLAEAELRSSGADYGNEPEYYAAVKRYEDKIKATYGWDKNTVLGSG
jgi:hypothetical protein